MLLDGSDSSKSRFMRDLTLWMGVSVMMLACLFSFFLSVRAQQGVFRSAPLQGGGAPRREAPRRLSPEQVEELVPECTACDYLLHVTDHESQHAEICSICLDEYCPDDVLGELPCAHVFHSDCICKCELRRWCVCKGPCCCFLHSLIYTAFHH